MIGRFEEKKWKKKKKEAEDCVREKRKACLSFSRIYELICHQNKERCNRCEIPLYAYKRQEP